MPFSTSLQATLAAALLIGAGSIAAVQAQANDMFPTKAAAERPEAHMKGMYATKAEAQKRAGELKCKGVCAMGSAWMPCADERAWNNPGVQS